jgi:hypothetical protein
VRLNWKILRIAACIALVSLGAGCSGINVSKSISPATFLLPGLLQADPPPPDPNGDLPVQGKVEEIAQF